MKDISETHPSLWKEYDVISNHIGESGFTRETIQNHTIDKQVLKEKIDKVFPLDDYEDAVHNKMLKKELGLVDD